MTMDAQACLDGLNPEQAKAVAQILNYTRHAQQELTELGAVIYGPLDIEHQSGITCFTLPEVDLAQLRLQCMEAGVVLSHRDGRLRISPHAYNNREDLDRLLALIDKAVA